MLQRLSYMTFQFYDSPIKSRALPPRRGEVLWFQFYDSPIKSKALILCSARFSVFQFYDSPIKSVPTISIIATAGVSFNSMIVRLKANYMR